MTIPWGTDEEPEIELTAIPVQPVHVVSSDAELTRPAATEFGRWKTLLVANVVPVGITSAPGAMQICNRNLRRRRLRIIVSLSVAAQPVTDGVIVGSRDFIHSGVPMNPANINGGYLPLGTSLTYEAQQELWAAYPLTNTDSVYVTVCDEIYASPAGKETEE